MRTRHGTLLAQPSADSDQRAARLALRIFAALCLALGVLPVATWISGAGAVPWYGGAVLDWTLRGAAVVLLALLAARLLGDRVDAALSRARTLLLRPSDATFAAAAAAAALGLALIVAQVSFAGLPFTSDEMAQQFHARVLASGHVAAVAENHPEFFNTAPVYDRDGRWFSQYPIGGPAFTALGVLFGAPWVVNPLLLALATWMLYRFLAGAFDEVTARLTTLVWIASPMVLIMSASQMNHVPALAFTLLALRTLVLWDAAADARRRMRHAIVIGLSIGVVALVRPLDAAVVAVAVGAFQLWRCRGAWERAGSLAAQLAAFAIPVAVLLWANARTTGGALHFAYEALNGPEHAIGFHVDPNGTAHTPARGLAYTSGYLLRLSRYLFEWPLPGMVFIAAGLAARRRPNRWDLLLAGLGALVLTAYAAYWFDGFFAGPRFLFTALPAFVYFAVRAPLDGIGWIARPLARRAFPIVVALCIAVAWLIPAGGSTALGRVAQYRDQRTKLKTDVELQIARAGIRNALVFVNESWRGRLLARLRVLGLSAFRAERVVNTTDACALQTALDAEDTLMATSPSQRAGRVIQSAAAFGAAQRVPGLDADQTLALVPGTQPTPTCLREFQRDAAGTIPYAIFLARQTIGADARVGGNVVFVRDLGGRNELLRSRFADRAWYRYRTPAYLGDTSPSFQPYGR